MNFSPENQNYVAQFRSLLQQHHAGRGGVAYSPVMPAALETSGLLAKLMPSVIQSSQNRGFEKAEAYCDDPGPDPRDSTGSNSNVSPGSVGSSGEDLEILTKSGSPGADRPQHSEDRRSASPLPETPRLSVSPKSEMSESIGESDLDVSYNNILHQQLLHRKGSILQYCLTNPRPANGSAGGGSDAEAEHTSNSPGSSRSDLGFMQDDAFPGQLLQCEFCDFSNSSRFHFNSHMNTHCVHRCPVPECNYSTRTEGRLRRHVKNHHDPSGVKDENDVEMMEEKPRSKRSSEAGSSGAPGSSGKVKSYRCKQCHEFIATNKNDYYDHQRLHIKPEKLLQCPLDGCRFVTEYKHHLEYHVRNHSGSKPFKCPNSNCNYTCVNKSMLNSHMKSHSSYYQHRCECGYVTKYTHSLKLHLNKYKHKAMNNGPESAQISMPGSPQEAPPPKMEAEKPPKRRRNANKINLQLQQQNLLSNGGYSPYQMQPGASMADAGQMVMTGGFPYGMYGGVGGPISQFHAASIYNNLLLSAAAANGMMPGMTINRFVRGPDSPDPNFKRESPSPTLSDRQDEPQDFSHDFTGRKQNSVLRMLPQSRVIRSVGEVNGPNNNGTSPLDLSGGKENGSERQSESPKSEGSSGNATEVSSSRRRRKGPAFKIDLAVQQRLQDSQEEEDIDQSNDLRALKTPNIWQIVQPRSPPEVFVPICQNDKDQSSGTSTPARNEAFKQASVILAVNGTSPAKDDRRDLLCGYCSMTFEDKTMYDMHMGFHSQDDPFTCTCGHDAGDKVSFFLHIAAAPHSHF